MDAGTVPLGSERVERVPLGSGRVERMALLKEWREDA